MFRFLRRLFQQDHTLPEEKEPMKKYLIVGLGNIGAEYTETRHNIGFKILDALAQEQGFPFETAKLGDIGTYKLKGKNVVCLKPSTYMNRSGKALKYWMEKEKIPLEHVLVITDDINLALGTIRIKAKGSDGGHNGLKDIQLVLGTTHYNRFRFGVGSDFSKGRQVDYVLGVWNETEEAVVKERLPKTVEAINSFVLSGLSRTMNIYNGS